MNIQLVQSLANAIKALSPEERELLNQLTNQSNWQELRPKILANAQVIQQRLSDRSLKPNIDEIIHQIREERDGEFIADLFPIEEKS
ncbi:MAG: hypothetical protein RMX96_01220 [Nostoc sp. ChiSLP02]|nr:hypothetical protein [Nostoc sp. DedSLP05]MDZ8102974.1 hypothetical protein [Nostoc sp. DedSLP01]MDZ8183469.1 hypothetical protein [Nostoc sp. ChiSLP02]